MSNRPLTLLQKRFAEEYFISGKIEHSAIVAGSSEKSARTTGRKWLQKAAVQEYLSELRKPELKKTMSRRDKIIQELERMAFSNIARFTRLSDDGRRIVDFSDATEEELAAITQIKTKTRHIYTPKGEHIGTEHHDQFNMADKYRGLELLGKVEGMFQSDEVKVTVDVADRLLAASPTRSVC